ncbi:MAG: SPASM domain-containing protein, partial [Bacteriovoracaceae bacterium]|nr:SPASM domain-containing protein [Bacteriovoracaceae bacterium]
MSKKIKYTADTIPRHMCPVPFTSLIFNPDGNVGCCRERTNFDTVGNIKNQTVEEIWNGEEIRAWRREFLEGEPKRCKVQMEQRKCNLQEFDLLMLPETDFSEFQINPPLRISPDFNGQCNLECKMCKIWTMDNGLYDKLGFWIEAEEKYFPHIKFLDPLAGEPFIQKDLFRLIKKMKEKSPHATWRFTTNGHWKFNDYISDHLDMIENIYSIQTSIDAATPELYARVRRKGILSVVLENLKQQQRYRATRISRNMSGYNMLTIMTVIRDNWHEVPSMIELMDSFKTEYHFNKCNGPEELMLQTLPVEEQVEILDFFHSRVAAKNMAKLYTVM